jgi:hypothetical protein
MAFDERYVPLLHQANLLAVTDIIHRGMPVFNATAIMAMWIGGGRRLTPSTFHATR